MAPRIEPNKINEIPKPRIEPKIEKPVLKAQNPTLGDADKFSPLSRRNDLQLYGANQRERLERLYPAGTAGMGTFNDIRLARATNNADAVYTKTFNAELNNLSNPATSKNPPKNLIEVATRAENAYRAELAKSGFTPSDVRGSSVVKAADFLRNQANVPGDFTTLSPQTIRDRIANNQPTEYFVRIMDKNYLSGAGSKLSGPGSPHVWVATPEEVAGAKLDGFETMKRVGFSDQYINSLAAKGKNPSDFVLVVSEARGTNNNQLPVWDNIIGAAKNHPDFQPFQRKFNDANFWNQVQNQDYKGRFEEMNRLGLTERQYAQTLPRDERGAFLARDLMNKKLGVNEFFAADGRTARTDGRNSGYGVREFLIQNDPVASMQRSTFIELGDTGKTNLDATNTAPTIANNPLRLGSETRNGALIGGATSAVTSLPEVFDQARNGDYLGAATTLGANTALGTSVGAFSAGSERIVGRGLENALGNSRLANSLIDRAFTNGGAQNVVSRLAQTEVSNLSSSTFNSTVRQVAGRVGGAGVIGGVVNGGFAAYDQIGAYNRGEVTASQAIGTVTGEAAVGVGAGMAGAAAGAAIGSIIPGAGTIVGGVIGFGVGMAAGYLADKGLRGLGVNTLIAKGVTATIDTVSNVASSVTNKVSEAAGNLADGAKNMLSGAASKLSSIFG